MKKYIGTKQIEAMPMTKGDAYGANLLRSCPELSEQNDPGYHVRYEDGYESWSPKDVFEKAYKVADTFKDRLVIEQQDLADKLLKLSLFVDSPKFPEVVTGISQRCMLIKQRNHMSDYLEILNERIKTIED